ncbi:Small-conductance mechanosensitive channel [Pirellulimonas nuda]|uniref:Small-conductance mechanosensitive channel n=1 Tax=Pirellulimonas nuda TaxID=2528009 RepID=A0A518DCI6_9BACT|nr:mechanosensitive ion channel family protein [Pirellulimonas nuda]QDU89194.1 Small-conductance mechanosensitive channel [Pirellulimonas nuda]
MLALCVPACDALAQPPADPAPPADSGDAAPTPEAPARVSVEPISDDADIAKRLQRILRATGWFRDPVVRVDEGVAFLEGATGDADRKAWAQQLASKTDDVVAVVNNIKLDRPSMFDLSPARANLEDLLRGAIQTTPTLIVAALLFAATWLAARLAARVARNVAERRIDNTLLRGVLSKAAAIPVLLLGAYLALRVSGLTRLAVTVLGGTGVLGIVLGIAFRDIAENFLASILISIQRPFQTGDLVTIDDRQGFVQMVTTRGTLIMTLDGDHVQIPNALVYKSVIVNSSANPNQRLSFVVGVDYGDSASRAQRSVLEAVSLHEAVLRDPEPLVLVDGLASSTVNLRVFFWINRAEYSPLKVRSAVLRQVKRRLQSDGFTLPDESRELIFPQGVPIRWLGEPPPGGAGGGPDKRREEPALNAAAGAVRQSVDPDESEAGATKAEGGLVSEKKEIEDQAAASRPLQDGDPLLAAPAVAAR